ncbi:MAG TPA: hypothetical protein VK054_09720 [Beutenbergiaceae bacterium]|nr:hypothetical protein [Beutenbergiaceae bacterium]
MIDDTPKIGAYVRIKDGRYSGYHGHVTARYGGHVLTYRVTLDGYHLGTYPPSRLQVTTHSEQ